MYWVTLLTQGLTPQIARIPFTLLLITFKIGHAVAYCPQPVGPQGTVERLVALWSAIVLLINF